MPHTVREPDLDKNGYQMPTNVFTNLMECPNPLCNKLNFITEEIETCRFCGPDKSRYEDLIEKVREKNILKQFLYRTPRAPERKECKVCGRDHRKEN